MNQKMHSEVSALFAKSELNSRGISPFVAKCVAKYNLPRGGLILDIPCGYGRHSRWLADIGYDVVAADIDSDRVLSFTKLSDSMPESRCQGVVLNANEPLPFSKEVFDAVLVIDFVSQTLLATIAAFIKQDGHLIYQTMSGRAGNWMELPKHGDTRSFLAKHFDIIEYHSRSAGPTKTEAESIRAVLRRK